MKSKRPEYAPCGATHLVRAKNGAWSWLFQEPALADGFVYIECLETQKVLYSEEV